MKKPINYLCRAWKENKHITDNDKELGKQRNDWSQRVSDWYTITRNGSIEHHYNINVPSQNADVSYFDGFISRCLVGYFSLYFHKSQVRFPYRRMNFRKLHVWELTTWEHVIKSVWNLPTHTWSAWVYLKPSHYEKKLKKWDVYLNRLKLNF